MGRSRLEAIHGRLKTDLKRLETIIGRLMSYLGRLETILGAARTVCVVHMTATTTTITKSLRSILIGCQPHVRPLGLACEQPLAHGLAASVHLKTLHSMLRCKQSLYFFSLKGLVHEMNIVLSLCSLQLYQYLLYMRKWFHTFRQSLKTLTSYYCIS